MFIQILLTLFYDEIVSVIFLSKNKVLYNQSPANLTSSDLCVEQQRIPWLTFQLLEKASQLFTSFIHKPFNRTQSERCTSTASHESKKPVNK